MDSYFIFLAIKPDTVILYFNIVFFCMMVGIFIIRPLMIRAIGINRFKNLLKKYSADCAITCHLSGGFAGIDSYGGGFYQSVFNRSQ